MLVCGLMIPAGPGSAGTFQAAIVLVLALFLDEGAVNGQGVAYANVLWVVQILQQVLVGLVLMTISKGSLRGITGKLSEEQASNA